MTDIWSAPSDRDYEDEQRGYTVDHKEEEPPFDEAKHQRTINMITGDDMALVPVGESNHIHIGIHIEDVRTVEVGGVDAEDGIMRLDGNTMVCSDDPEVWDMIATVATDLRDAAMERQRQEAEDANSRA